MIDKLNRITIRQDNGSVKMNRLSRWTFVNGKLFALEDVDPYDVSPALERLADYEDTGFLPKEISQIVRCADCEYYEPPRRGETWGWCDIEYDCEAGISMVPEGFCSRGERKHHLQEAKKT